jgi:hypothetical protein
MYYTSQYGLIANIIHDHGKGPYPKKTPTIGQTVGNYHPKVESKAEQKSLGQTVGTYKPKVESKAEQKSLGKSGGDEALTEEKKKKRGEVARAMHFSRLALMARSSQSRSTLGVG